MSSSRGTRDLVAAAVVVALSALALALPASSPLYAETYPQIAKAGEALAKAELRYAFTPRVPTQYEESTFRATVLYGKAPPPTSGHVVRLGWSNSAELRAAKGDFEIRRVSDSRIYLDTGGVKQPDGRRSLSWTWSVRPLHAGVLHLTLEVIPFVTETAAGPGVNKPIDITVHISPVQHALDDVVAEARHGLGVQVPERLTVGSAATVTARLPLADHADEVSAELLLTRADGSSPVTIQPKGRASTSGGVTRRTWSVTPTEQGSVGLIVTSRISARVGETALRQDVTESVSRIAHESFGSTFFDTFIGRMTALLGLIGACAALLGHKRLRELFGRWRGRPAAPTQTSDPG